MIAGLFNHGAMPTLERLVDFTNARQQVLAHNAANLSTPNFRPRDLDPSSFQQQLSDAHGKRRRQARPLQGPLPGDPASITSARQHRMEPFGGDSRRGVMFHDRNDRDLERTMQAIAENTLTHNMGVELIRNQLDILKTAIRERI